MPNRDARRVEAPDTAQAPLRITVLFRTRYAPHRLEAQPIGANSTWRLTVESAVAAGHG